MNRSTELGEIFRVLERRFQCRFTLHRLRTPGWIAAFGPLPRYHLNRYCLTVKRDNPRQNTGCYHFDGLELQSFLQAHPETECLEKHCPLGVAELVFPLHSRERLAGILFAGPFRIGDTPPGEPLFAGARTPVPRKIETLRGKLPLLSPELRRELTALGKLAAFRVAALLTEEGASEAPSVREKIEGFLLEHYHQKCRLDDLAEALGLGRTQTCFLVKKHFSLCFNELLTEYRLGEARELLRNTDLAIEAIALRLGFADAGYFHRLFRRKTGVTPGAYRAIRPE